MAESIDLKLASEVIQRHFSTGGIDLPLKHFTLVDESGHGLLQLVWSEQNPFDSLLDSCCKNRRGENRLFYHFKDPGTLRKTIESKRLQINHLSWQADQQEFVEFYERTGLWDKENGFTHLPNDPSGKPMNVLAPPQIKDSIFTLSLSRAVTDLHWERYAAGGTGACLVLQVVDKPLDDEAERKFYELRDVCYDTGVRFSFIQQMQRELVERVGKPLNLSRVPALAALTKRHENFHGELETRLVSDYLYIEHSYRENPYDEVSPMDVTETNGRTRHYITRDLAPFPFGGERHFLIRMRGIIWGPNMNDTNLRLDLSNEVRKNYPNAFVADDMVSGQEYVENFSFPEGSELDPTDEWLRKMRGDS